MCTLIFDFDSTLITKESLDEILRQKLPPDIFLQNKALMTAALAGKSSFSETLKERLSLTPLYKQDFTHYGQIALSYISPHITQFLSNFDGQVWIVSGSLTETLLSVAEKLKIPPERVIGVKAKWGNDGRYQGIESFTSKWESALPYKKYWNSPAIVIGDAMTDFEIYRQGVADSFIAYTGVTARRELLEKCQYSINDFNKLQPLLDSLIIKE